MPFRQYFPGPIYDWKFLRRCGAEYDAPIDRLRPRHLDLGWQLPIFGPAAGGKAALCGFCLCADDLFFIAADGAVRSIAITQIQCR